MSAANDALGLAASGRATANVALNKTPLSTFVAQPYDGAPTLTFGTTALSGAQTINTVSSGVINTTNFAWYGPAIANLKNRGSAYPQTLVTVAANASADTLGTANTILSFNYTPSGSASLDIIRYGDSSTVWLYVDDKFIGTAGPAIATGTAQAGAASAITLTAGASGTTGFYNQAFVRITGGTGVGQIKRITAYNASTKVATVDSAWATVPDSTSTYSIESSDIGFALDGITGSLKYLNTSWPGKPVTRKITIVSGSQVQINIGQNDYISPTQPSATLYGMFVGDSLWDGTAGPLAQPIMAHQIANRLGLIPINLSSGSTGVWTRGQNNRMNFRNRIAPPPEAWEFLPPQFNSATAGTFTISITYNGTTQTTSALAYNASSATVEAALNALTFNGFAASSGVSWVGPSGQGCFVVARGDLNSRYIVIANGMTGATISVDSSGLTGGTAGPIMPYIGDVAKNVPKDANGNALPFYLFVSGSGNDGGASGYTPALCQANTTYLAQQIVSRFPTAIPVFIGVLSVVDAGNNGIIQAQDIANNAAWAAGAALLPLINGRVPFIDTYSNGQGGNAWIFGAGNIGAPTNGKNDVMRSLVQAGHPSGLGAGYFAALLVKWFFNLTQGRGVY